MGLNYGQRLLRNQASAREWVRRMPNFGRINNRWYPPTGKELKKEVDLILDKKSNLSSKQRRRCLFLYAKTQQEEVLRKMNDETISKAAERESK